MSTRQGFLPGEFCTDKILQAHFWLEKATVIKLLGDRVVSRSESFRHNEEGVALFLI
jgi:hypothetical protein